MWGFETVSLVFFNIFGKWRQISLTQPDRNPAQTYLHTTSDFRAARDTFFDENNSFNLNGKKIILMLVLLHNALHSCLIFFTSTV